MTAPSKSGPCKSWITVRNPKSPAYLRISEGAGLSSAMRSILLPQQFR